MFRNTRNDQDQDQRPRRRLSYANIVATMAVFLAIGGGAAFAASTLPANSVNSKTVKDNKLKSVDLKDGKAVSTDDVIDASLTGTDVADDSLTGTDVANASLTGADINDASLTGADVNDNSLTGDDVDESTLGQVPDAAQLQGRSATQFLSSSVYKRESAVDAGQQLGDGTFVKGQACDAGDVLLSGGPANINATSTLLESFPSPGTTNSWSARINKNNQTDNWSVVILCVNQ
jgi:uncharacterized protein YjbI with pentapeptide repeats